MQLTDELFELYRKLVEQIYINKDSYKEEKLNLFTLGIGKEYNNKLLVVGRAVNGWPIFLDKTDEKYKDSVLPEIKDRFVKDNLQWVIDCWGNTKNYNTKKSAFWRVSKRLACELVEHSDRVFNKIAWTNLYKMSKYSKGNPSSNLINIQFDLCQKILFYEIEFLKPEIIVFLTGWPWANGFLKDLKNQKTNSISQYVEFVGKLNNTLIVVGQHPQGKPEREHFEEIINEIKLCK